MINEIKKGKMQNEIKLIALDLDGTTLRSDKTIADKTKEVLKAAMQKGVHVMIATGRGYSSIPKELKSIEGIEYAVCANGADVRRLADEKSIYNAFLEEEAARAVIDHFKKDGKDIEVFTDGKAYVSQREYDDVVSGRSKFRDKEYMEKTRHPLQDIYNFAYEHATKIENISVFFPGKSQKQEIWNGLLGIKNITITSSFPYNVEVGGAHTSKANALLHMLDEFGLAADQMMCCGDGQNDIQMFHVAGIAVAMGNADDIVKNEADFVTDTNDNDGVAKAIEKFVLKC